jgi:hypothetical protein
MLENLSIKLKNMETKDFFKRIDWVALKNQKLTLLNAIDMYLPYHTASNDLTGILHLLDAIQDFAVDELGIPEKDVFCFSDYE